MVWALNFQLKSARFLSSRNLASRIRRSIARWRLRAAGSPRISSRKFRCDSPSCSARASAASSVWSESGNFSVFASSRTRSRRFVPWSVLFLVAVRFFFGVVMGVGLLKQQVLIFRGGSRRCGVVAEQFPEVGWLVFRHAVPTGLRPGLHGQDAFHRLPSCQTRVRDAREVQVQRLQVSQSFYVVQSGIRNQETSKGEPPELAQPFQTAQLSILDGTICKDQGYSPRG